MTGKPYEQMLVDADPYRPVGGDLVVAADELFAQIVAEPTVKRPPYRLAVVSVAAAVLVAVAVIPVLRRDTPPAPGVPASPAVTPSKPAPSEPAPSKPAPPTVQEKVRKAAEQGLRLAFGEPGWDLIHLEPVGERMGESAYQKGNQRVEVNWYPANQYDERRVDKTKGAKKVTIGGLTGFYIPSGKNGFVLVTEPHDGVLAVVTASSNWTLAGFRTFIAGLRQVDVPTWIALSSTQIIEPAEATDRATQLLGDVPVPPGADRTELSSRPASLASEFDWAVAEWATCAWLTEWQRANTVGDAAGLRAAEEALRNSKKWTLLTDSVQHGSSLRQRILPIANRVASGKATESQMKFYLMTMRC